MFSENSIIGLRSDSIWLGNYLESVKLAALAWGWDVESGTTVKHPQHWQKWNGHDVRLSKIIRSLWLFEEESYFSNMQVTRFSSRLIHLFRNMLVTCFKLTNVNLRDFSTMVYV